MKKEIKKLKKAVGKLKEQNEDLTEALEDQAQEIRAMRETLESSQKRTDQPEAEDLGEEKSDEEPEEEPNVEPDAEPEEVEEPEVTEAAERRAGDLGVNLSEVEGTGTEGRILVKDVEVAADSEE